MSEETEKNRKQQPDDEVVTVEQAKDPVLERLLAQERELERLRRFNERLRKRLRQKQSEQQQQQVSQPQMPAEEPAPPSTQRRTYASRLYSILRRDYGD